MHGVLLKWRWLAPVIIAVLIAVHGTVFYRLLSHTAWTEILTLGLVLLLAHLGVFGSIYALLRRRFRFLLLVL